MKRAVITAILLIQILTFAQRFQPVNGSGSYQHTDEERPSYARDRATQTAFRSAAEGFILQNYDRSEIVNYEEKLEEILSEPEEIFFNIDYSKNEYNPLAKTFYIEFTANIDSERVRRVLEQGDEKVAVKKDEIKTDEVKPAEPVRNLQRRYDEVKKAGFNVVFEGGFNLMKSWENYPDRPDNLDDIPGAGLVGMRLEYDFGQFMRIPHTYIFAGMNYPITVIGKLGVYDDDDELVVDENGDMHFSEYSHNTLLWEFGLSKKFFTVDDFAIIAGGSYVMQRMSLNKKSRFGNFNETYPLSSQGFRGIMGLGYNMGDAWIFEFLVSYTSMEPLMNKSNKVFSDKDEDGIFYNFPFGNVKDNEYLVPDGLSIKVGLGLRL